MSVYMTESEQIETIKKLWGKYGNIITVLLSLILLTIAGFRYWSWHNEKHLQQASATYERMMFAFSEQDAKGVKAYVKTLNMDFSDTIYSDVATLTLAKLYIISNDFTKARQEIEKVVKDSNSEVLREVAKIRLARLLIHDKNYNLALQTLNSIQSKIYNLIVLELKGDIYKLLGKNDLAKNSYSKALLESKKQGIGNAFLEMKLSDMQ